MSQRRLIFLVGAPSGKLSWTDESLLKEPVVPFTRAHSRASDSPVKWRILDGNQPVNDHERKALFLNTSVLLSATPQVFENIYLPHLCNNSFTDSEILHLSISECEDSSLDGSHSSENVQLSTGPKDKQYRRCITVYDLKDIPNASYLSSIVPQTLSVILVVAIIGFNQPRRVFSRRL